MELTSLSLIVHILLTVMYVNGDETEGTSRFHLISNDTYGDIWWYLGNYTWNGARNVCQQDGMDLASLSDKYVRVTVADRIAKIDLELDLLNKYSYYVWVGATRTREHGWEWLSGQTADNFEVQDMKYHCGNLWVSSNEIRFKSNEICDFTNWFICGKHGCHGSKNCYRIIEKKLSWPEARQECFNINMDLLTFSNDFINSSQKDGAATLSEYLGIEVPAGIYWIGLIYRSWVWTDGQPVISGNHDWDIKESIEFGNIGLNCMILMKPYFYIPVTCDIVYWSFLCQEKRNTMGAISSKSGLLVAILIPLSLILLIILIILIILFRKRIKSFYEEKLKKKTSGKQETTKESFKKASTKSKSSDRPISPPPPVPVQVEYSVPNKTSKKKDGDDEVSKPKLDSNEVIMVRNSLYGTSDSYDVTVGGTAGNDGVKVSGTGGDSDVTVVGTAGNYDVTDIHEGYDSDSFDITDSFDVTMEQEEEQQAAMYENIQFKSVC